MACKQPGMCRKDTDSGHANTTVLKRQIEALIIVLEAQDLPSKGKAGFSTTDAFKVPDKNDAASGSQYHEIATIPGYMCYRKKLSIVIPNSTTGDTPARKFG